MNERVMRLEAAPSATDALYAVGELDTDRGGALKNVPEVDTSVKNLRDTPGDGDCFYTAIYRLYCAWYNNYPDSWRIMYDRLNIIAQADNLQMPTRMELEQPRYRINMHERVQVDNLRLIIAAHLRKNFKEFDYEGVPTKVAGVNVNDQNEDITASFQWTQQAPSVPPNPNDNLVRATIRSLVESMGPGAGDKRQQCAVANVMTPQAWAYLYSADVVADLLGIGVDVWKSATNNKAVLERRLGPKPAEWAALTKLHRSGGHIPRFNLLLQGSHYQYFAVGYKENDRVNVYADGFRIYDGDVAMMQREVVDGGNLTGADDDVTDAAVKEKGDEASYALQERMDKEKAEKTAKKAAKKAKKPAKPAKKGKDINDAGGDGDGDGDGDPGGDGDGDPDPSGDGDGNPDPGGDGDGDPDPGGGGGGGGGGPDAGGEMPKFIKAPVEIRPRTFYAQEYSLDDAPMSKEQLEWAQGQMQTAHDSFIEHQASRAGYGRIMLMFGEDGRAKMQKESMSTGAATGTSRSRNKEYERLLSNDPNQEELKEMNNTVFIGKDGMLIRGETNRKAAEKELAELDKDADPAKKKEIEERYETFAEMRRLGQRLSWGYALSMALILEIEAFSNQKNKWVGLFAWFNQISSKVTSNLENPKDRAYFYLDKGRDLARRHNNVGGNAKNIYTRDIQYWLGFWEFMEYLKHNQKKNDGGYWFVDDEIAQAIEATTPPDWAALGWKPS